MGKWATYRRRGGRPGPPPPATSQLLASFLDPGDIEFSLNIATGFDRGASNYILPVSAVVTSVVLVLRNPAGATGEMFASLWATAGSVPDFEVGVSLPVLAQSIPGGFSEVTFTFPVIPPINGGETFWLAFSAPPSGAMVWRVRNTAFVDQLLDRRATAAAWSVLLTNARGNAALTGIPI
jgi:hypothetical protein